MRSLPILMFSLSSAAMGQSAGMIAGTVLDLGGDKVANAPIQVTNTATKAVYKTTSSGEGSYTLAELPA
ncbi:MAG: carboxypeptidase regulatory-like domain-containing protein, partial [Bryobacterales bacterium]|nr:carboxypeptidase regulatory-like domain-containing protein [Bryobacterales bacterium]